MDALQEDLPAIEQVAMVKLFVVAQLPDSISLLLFHRIVHCNVPVDLNTYEKCSHWNIQQRLNAGGDGDLRRCCGQRDQVF